MNKTKKILAATGVAVAVAVAVMAYFVWSAYSAKTVAMEGDDTEGVEGLETVTAAASSLSKVSGGKIYPCPASVRGVESNTAAIVAWRDEAAKLAARGDRPVKVTTPPQFKSDIVEAAKRIATMPGAANGKLVKPDFTFGPFRPYVAEGQMPAETKLAELTRQWDDVVTVVEMLVASGITELLDVQFKAAEAPKEEEDEGRGKKRRSVRKAVQAEEKNDADARQIAHSYVFSFTTRASGLVKAVNALTTGERFVVIDGLTFVREKDVIAEALGEGEAKAEAQQTGGGRRGRRRGRAAEEKQEENETAKNSIVTDPLLDAPIKAELTVTVYDFRSLESEKAEEKGEAK